MHAKAVSVLVPSRKNVIDLKILLLRLLYNLGLSQWQP
jgi:hypothetical protein